MNDLFSFLEYDGGMPFTIEEARTLDTFSRCKSISATAQEMRKASSAVVYSLESIEKKSGLTLFDRSAYRTTLLPTGERVLEAARRLLTAVDELRSVCTEISSGWEPELRVVVDGVVPMKPIFQAIKKVNELSHSTQFHVSSEFLKVVESKFHESNADFMLSLIRPEDQRLESIPLFKIAATLVASPHHPLFEIKNHTPRTLARHSILTVRGSDPRLHTSTSTLETHTTVHLNDFHSKREAILARLGYGWLPNYLIADDLKHHRLKIVPWKNHNHHTFQLHLYHRGTHRLGRAARLFIQSLKEAEI